MIPKTGGYFQKQFEVSVCFLDRTGKSIKETELGKRAKWAKYSFRKNWTTAC